MLAKSLLDLAKAQQLQPAGIDKVLTLEEFITKIFKLAALFRRQRARSLLATHRAVRPLPPP
jgi:hypothetical protein